jgi:hypothetical protein
MPKLNLTADEAFFYYNAGFAYNPATETKIAGHKRCARELAQAEALYLQAHKCADVGCQWEHDTDAAQDGEQFDTCEFAAIWHRPEDQPAHTLASLGAILDATDTYRRVIRAELAEECADELRAIIEANT